MPRCAITILASETNSVTAFRSMRCPATFAAVIPVSSKLLVQRTVLKIIHYDVDGDAVLGKTE